MTFSQALFNNSEKAIFTLRGLYERYGYSQYKMSKFEEYDLYVKNKDFLISDNVITFTDRQGKLKALKPDVTLSILKNGKDKEGQIQKVYYNENVYRDFGDGFKEIMQVGLECIGDVSYYDIYETVLLAAKSLSLISENYVLDISSLAVVEDILVLAKLPKEYYSRVLECIGEKNLHELKAICKEADLTESDTAKICSLISLYGSPDEVMPKLEEILKDEESHEFCEFRMIIDALRDSDVYKNLRIDFSVVHDINYYNGIVFKGFIEGVPSSVLSGGQDDLLVIKMGRNAQAIGFAIYLDKLERLGSDDNAYDFDTLLLYNDVSNISDIAKAYTSLSKSGSVMVCKNVPEKLKFRYIKQLTKSGVIDV